MGDYIKVILSFKAPRLCDYTNKEPHFCLQPMNSCVFVKGLEYISISSEHGR